MNDFFSIFFRQVFSIFQMIFFVTKNKILFVCFIFFVAGKMKGKEFSASITIEGFFYTQNFMDEFLPQIFYWG